MLKDGQKGAISQRDKKTYGIAPHLPCGLITPEILEKIASLPNVVWAGVVTGRYDIVAEVVIAGGKAELYRFTTETILKMGNVIRSETFVIMKSIGNWVRLPRGVEEI